MVTAVGCGNISSKQASEGPGLQHAQEEWQGLGPPGCYTQVEVGHVGWLHVVCALPVGQELGDRDRL